MLDTGNTFLNCIDFDTCKKLGFSQTDLIPSHKKAVKQAGKGSVIQILGLLPYKANNGFKFKKINSTACYRALQGIFSNKHPMTWMSF